MSTWEEVIDVLERGAEAISLSDKKLEEELKEKERIRREALKTLEKLLKDS